MPLIRQSLQLTHKHKFSLGGSLDELHDGNKHAWWLCRAVCRLPELTVALEVPGEVAGAGSGSGNELNLLRRYAGQASINLLAPRRMSCRRVPEKYWAQIGFVVIARMQATFEAGSRPDGGECFGFTDRKLRILHFLHHHPASPAS